MANVVDFYLGLKNDEEHIASKEYQLLKQNKVDTALLDGVDPDENAGGVELGKVTDGETNILVDDVVDFVKSMPKDMLLSVTRGGMNAFGFVNSLTNLVGVNPDSSYEFAKDKIDNQLKRLDELDKDSPLVSKMLAVVGQDAAFIYPAYKKFKSLGIPKQYSLPLAFGVGQSLAFNKDQSMFVDTDAVNSLKRYINIEPGSSSDDMVDNALLAIEGSSLGYLFDKLGPVLKGIKNSNWQQNAVAVGGATAAAEGASKIEDINLDNQLKEIQDDKSNLDRPSENLIASIGPEAAKLAVQYLRSKGKKVQELNKLSGGTGRSVFQLDDDKVIKIAKLQRGIRENSNEIDDFMISSWRPRVFESGDDYVVVENVKRADGEVRRFLKPLQQFSPIDFDKKTSELQSAMEQLGLDDFMNYNLLWNDFKSARNWGKTKDGRIVLVDGGALDDTIMSKDVPEYVQKDWQNILSGRRKEGMGKFIITATGGSTGYKVLDNIQNNIISETTKKE